MGPWLIIVLRRVIEQLLVVQFLPLLLLGMRPSRRRRASSHRIMPDSKSSSRLDPKLRLLPARRLVLLVRVVLAGDAPRVRMLGPPHLRIYR